MIKAIIFDCIGVFTKKGLGRTLDIVSERFGFDRVKLEPEYKKLAKVANLGKMTALEVCQTLIDEFQVDVNAEDIRQVWVDCYQENPNYEMYKYAKELSKKYKICLFSNYSDAFDDVNQKLKLEEVFEPDMIFISSKLGIKKPEKEAFEYVLKEINCKPEEVIFIDDREDNFAEAVGMGIHGILFKNVDQLKNDMDKILSRVKSNEK